MFTGAGIIENFKGHGYVPFMPSGHFDHVERNVEGPDLDKDTNTVTFTVQELPHHRPVTLDPFYLLVPSSEVGYSSEYTLKYTLWARNVPEVQRGDLFLNASYGHG